MKLTNILCSFGMLSILINKFLQFPVLSSNRVASGILLGSKYMVQVVFTFAGFA